MAESRQLEFFVLRYVPNAVREEFVNVGLLAREAGSGFSTVRLTEDWSRVRCVDPEADLEVLTGLGLQLKDELREARDWALVIRKLEDLFSNMVQASSVKACLAVDAAKEIEFLAKLYLEGPRAARKPALSGRQVILRKMEEALESAGILGFMKRAVQVAAYTGKKGDPQRFDFAYPLKNDVRFLQAVSLKASVQPALVLGARFPAMEHDIFLVDGARVSLTAVVDDGLDRMQDEIGFALSLMEENRIRVAPVAEMSGIAEEVRRQLGV